jgi:hypothetical protein
LSSGTLALSQDTGVDLARSHLDNQHAGADTLSGWYGFAGRQHQRTGWTRFAHSTTTVKSMPTLLITGRAE